MSWAGSAGLWVRAGRVRTYSSTTGGTMKKYLLPLSVAALLLSGCASEGQAGSASETVAASETANEPGASDFADIGDSAPQTMSQGSFMFESPDGATGTVKVPGEAPADIEELRTMSGADPVTYLTGTLDNRRGSEVFDVYTISVYDPEGNEYMYEPAEDYVGSIFPEYDSETYEQYQDVQSRYNVVADALERIDFAMVGPELPEEITGVVISSGFDGIAATPAG